MEPLHGIATGFIVGGFLMFVVTRHWAAPVACFTIAGILYAISLIS